MSISSLCFYYLYLYRYNIFVSSAAVADFLHPYETMVSSDRISCSKGLFRPIIFQ